MHEYHIISDGSARPITHELLIGLNSSGAVLVVDSNGRRIDVVIRPGRTWEPDLKGTTNLGETFTIIKRGGKWWLQTPSKLKYT